MAIKRAFVSSSSDHPSEPPKEQPVTVVPMFEKPLTPSDVGKLNRLVVPKQHAEKHFPLAGRTGDGDHSLLSFEDEEASERCWRFRYSYWSSSRSYVLTKGWSRYVKEKRLVAGDLVIFGHSQLDPGRWFIGWRKQPDVGAAVPRLPAPNMEKIVFSGGAEDDNVVIGGGSRRSHSSRQPIFRQFCQPFADGVHHGAHGSVEILQRSRTTEAGNSRRLRLFGVNLECQVDCDPDTTHQQLNYSYSSSCQLHYDRYF